MLHDQSAVSEEHSRPSMLPLNAKGRRSRAWDESRAVSRLSVATDAGMMDAPATEHRTEAALDG
jgi:hypothetical protein